MPSLLRGQVRPAVTLTLILCVLTGVVYPGVVTGLARLFFPRQANGSLIAVGGKVIGSRLIGQAFARPGYFHPRPSAAGAGYDGTASGGTNEGPTSRALAESIAARVDSVHRRDGVRGPVPADMVTASGSGLDPHISPANAMLQVMRLARARGVRPEAIRALVQHHVEARQLGVFGEPRVNVLELNLALDSLFPVRPTPGAP